MANLLMANTFLLQVCNDLFEATFGNAHLEERAKKMADLLIAEEEEEKKRAEQAKQKASSDMYMYTYTNIHKLYVCMSYVHDDPVECMHEWRVMSSL
jgi:hypothetical protein